MHVKARDDRCRERRGLHTSSLPSDRPLTVAHGRYLLFAMAGRAAAIRARLTQPFDTEGRPPSR